VSVLRRDKDGKDISRININGPGAMVFKPEGTVINGGPAVRQQLPDTQPQQSKHKQQVPRQNKKQNKYKRAGSKGGSGNSERQAAPDQGGSGEYSLDDPTASHVTEGIARDGKGDQLGAVDCFKAAAKFANQVGSCVVFIVFSLRVLGRFFNSLEWSEIVCRRARGVGSQTTAGAAVYAQEPTPTKCLLARQPPAHLTNR
jgi:hypothetical protein